MVVDSRDAYLNSMDPKQFSHFDNFRHFTLIHNTLGLNFRECMRETEKICAICGSHQNDVQIRFKRVAVGVEKWHGTENDIFFYIAAHKIVHKSSKAGYWIECRKQTEGRWLGSL